MDKFSGFTLKIEMGNDACKTKHHIEDILDEVALDLIMTEESSGAIYDENGNRVGHWEFS